MGEPNILSQRLDHRDSLYNNKNVVLIKLEFLLVYVIEGLTFKEEKHSFLTNIYWNNRAS